MGLNEQELRNCVYRGPFCDLLAKMEKDPYWRKIKGGDKPEPRFVEREMILRFFSFANRLDQCNGKLKPFLNEFMGLYAPKSEQDINKMEAMFQLTMKNIYAVFGQNSGRLCNTGTEDKPAVEGNLEPKFSISALDIQASALVNQPPAKVQLAAEQVRESYLFYLLTNPQVRLAISRQPAGKTATKVRWTGFRDQVNEILEGTSVEPRFFAYQYRKERYDSSTCQLCKKQIHTFEDSTVDHIYPYSKGGKTIPENAQLAHRSCNARKCANVNLRGPRDREKVTNVQLGRVKFGEPC